ncbi:MAG: hypothetical protein DRJ32_07630, partial [Thermoprotei archaeon]
MSFPLEYSSTALAIAWCFTFYEFIYFIIRFINLDEPSRREYNAVLWSLGCLIITSFLLTFDLVGYVGLDYSRVIDDLKGSAYKLEVNGNLTYMAYSHLALFGAMHGIITETAALIAAVFSFFSTGSPMLFAGLSLARGMYRMETGLAVAGMYLSQNLIVLATVFRFIAYFSACIYPLLYVIGLGLLPSRNFRSLGVSFIVFSLCLGVFLPAILITLNYDFMPYNIKESPPAGAGWLKLNPVVKVPTRSGDRFFRAPPGVVLILRGNVSYLNGSKRVYEAWHFVDGCNPWPHHSFNGTVIPCSRRYSIEPVGWYRCVGLIWSFRRFNVFSDVVYVNSSNFNRGVNSSMRFEPVEGERYATITCYPVSSFEDGYLILYSDIETNTGWVDLSRGWILIGNYSLNSYLGCPRFKAVLTRNLRVVKAKGFFKVVRVVPAVVEVELENGTVANVTIFPNVTYRRVDDNVFIPEEKLDEFLTVLEQLSVGDYYIEKIDCVTYRVVLNISNLKFEEELTDKLDATYMYLVDWTRINEVLSFYSRPYYLVASISYPENCTVLRNASITILCDAWFLNHLTKTVHTPCGTT